MNYIDKTSIIGDDVILGDNNYIGPFCYITGKTIIGNNNRFESHVSIGTPPEHRDYISLSGITIIGNNNIFREFTTVNSSSLTETKLCDNILMLRNSHVGHDSYIESNVTLSCNCLIGGHSHIMEGVNFALGSICHQNSIIGAYSMIGMGGVVTKKTKIEPGNIYVGNPVKFFKKNTIGLDRNSIGEYDLNLLIVKYNKLIKYEI